MANVVLKKVGQEPKLINFDGNFDEVNKLLDLRSVAYIPYDLDVKDMAIVVDPLHKKGEKIPNFFVYDRYDYVCGDALIVKYKFDEKLNEYVLLDIDIKEFHKIQKYMEEEKYV